MSTKLITVFGATGLQGSSVLRSLQNNIDKPFTLRGITRNPSSESAQKLSASGIEVVKADGWDKGSLLEAFKGSWGVFANTNTDDPVFENPEETRTEVDLGKNIVDAAVESGVEVFVYSGFNSAKAITKGRVSAIPFDDKSAIWEYAKATGAFKSVISVGPGWYFEAFLDPQFAPIFGGFPHVPSEDSELVLRLPKWGGNEDVPFISIADDYGDIVHGVFLNLEKWNGKLVQGVSDIRDFNSLVKAFQTVTGKKSRYEVLPRVSDLESYGARTIEETVKPMFALCQESGGRYFGDETESATAAELKKQAAEARGEVGEETKLMTYEKWFKREFVVQG
ncbi:NAD(P)-binding protein [Lentithecium fluviatile CBS 122367]|uniref:NAD(P)-binding protein n=1 Tax=Lentithecium fluviatile CBS 122367 TaxID=1168545 RepID=A0A6G1J806_9PLEO|nr:NAD(P)-binding protein [Lentithecium fluviatile CBS 122367]